MQKLLEEVPSARHIMNNVVWIVCFHPNILEYERWCEGNIPNVDAVLTIIMYFSVRLIFWILYLWYRLFTDVKSLL